MNRLSDQPLRAPVMRNYVVDVSVASPPGGAAELEPLLDAHPGWVLLADDAEPRLRIPVTATGPYGARIKARNLLGDLPVLDMTVEPLDGLTPEQTAALIAFGKAFSAAFAVLRSAMLAWGRQIMAAARALNLVRRPHDRHHPKPLAIDGREYARRQRARRRRRR